MHDSDEDDELAEPYFAELCDISDVTYDMIPRKSRREVLLMIKAKERDFNLMKFYLALKAYTEKVEEELGVMAEAEGEH